VKNKKMKFETQRNILEQRIEIVLFSQDLNGSDKYRLDGGPPNTDLPTLVWMIQADEDSHSPTFSLEYEEAQELLDMLLSVGVVPSDPGKVSTRISEITGKLAAQGDHLEDMRALVAHSLKVKLPGAVK